MPGASESGSTPAYTLADLENWPEAGICLGVIGHPIEHSISPQMHNAALAAMATEENGLKEWKYYPFDIRPGQLASALDLMHSRGFRGVNLTIPHKVAAVELLSEIDYSAKTIGAVNTLLWHTGGYQGFNTDGFGLEKALEFDLEAHISGETIVILGAGGAARAAAAHCLLNGCRKLWIGNRNQDHLRNLLTSLDGIESGAPVEGFNLAEPPADLPDRGILINATSLGLKSEDPSPIPLGKISPNLKVLDMVYNPPQTSLLREAKKRGMAAANGLSMLVWQGVRSLEIWTGREVPAGEMSAAASAALA